MSAGFFLLCQQRNAIERGLRRTLVRWDGWGLKDKD